ncbi:MAG: hypothetical protein JOZ95_17425, partial [Solirubrobacterales bacterium]|nr:hypothetical protein [Solirubrobacterales bacterium]
EPGVSLEEVREHLRRRLPDYMHPAHLVTLPRLPTTSNGKIDKHALPPPPIADIDRVSPRTATERTLAGIWRSLLQHERVGIHDNFFDLGGHSLLAVQLSSRIRTTFAVDLSLRALFDAATLADLATAVDHATPAGLATSTPIARVSRERYRVRMSQDGTLELDEALRETLLREMRGPA